MAPDGRPPEFFLGAEATEQVADWLASVGLESEPNIVAMAPGAAHATKRWPLEHWRRLIRQCGHGRPRRRHRGWARRCRPGAALSDDAGARVANAAGTFGLQATGALLQRARALVSGDTGVMHMATGSGNAGGGAVRPHGRGLWFLPLHPPRPPCWSCPSPAGPAPRRGARGARWATTAAWSISSPASCTEALGRRLR